MADINANVKVTRDNVESVMQAILALATTRVMVGVPASSAFRPQAPGEHRTPPNNAELAYIHEFGAPEANIPPRPFLIPTIEEMQPEVVDRLRKIATQAVSGAGRPETVDKGFHRIGLRAQNAVRKKITDGPFAPLAPYTLYRRRQRGHTGTKPLIEFGHLRRSITYAIRKIQVRLK